MRRLLAIWEVPDEDITDIDLVQRMRHNPIETVRTFNSKYRWPVLVRIEGRKAGGQTST